MMKKLKLILKKKLGVDIQWKGKSFKAKAILIVVINKAVTP